MAPFFIIHSKASSEADEIASIMAKSPDSSSGHMISRKDTARVQVFVSLVKFVVLLSWFLPFYVFLLESKFFFCGPSFSILFSKVLMRKAKDRAKADNASGKLLGRFVGRLKSAASAISGSIVGDSDVGDARLGWAQSFKTNASIAPNKFWRRKSDRHFLLRQVCGWPWPRDDFCIACRKG